MILNLKMVTKNRLTEKKSKENQVISFEQELASSLQSPRNSVLFMYGQKKQKKQKTLKIVNNHDLS